MKKRKTALIKWKSRKGECLSIIRFVGLGILFTKSQGQNSEYACSISFTIRE